MSDTASPLGQFEYVDPDAARPESPENEQHLRLLAGLMPEVIWVAELAPRRVVFASPSFENVWGYPAALAIARPDKWESSIHDDDRTRVVTRFSQWASGALPAYDIVFRIVRPNGEVRWIHERAVLTSADAASPARANGISTDITGLRAADGERRRAEAVREEIERLSRTGSSCWKPTSEDLAWSPEMFRIFEFPVDVPPNVHMVRDRIHPEDLAHFNQTVEQAVLEGLDFAVEVRLLMPGGRIKHLQVITHAFRDDTGAVVEFIGAVKDVTDQKRAQNAFNAMRDALAHATRVTALGELAASIAHELNQPLQGIVSNASTCLRLLAEEQADLDGARDTARRTLRDGNRAAEVIARLRALYRKAKPQMEPFALHEAIEEVLGLLNSELIRSRVVLTRELAADVHEVCGDKVQLQQVVLNLVMNACDAMSSVESRPRTLLIATSNEEERMVRVAIRDSGTGIDPALAERLFQPFVTSKPDGMGIGLSLSRSIIEAHRGQLHAHSHGEEGATFEFKIPAELTPDRIARGVG